MSFKQWSAAQTAKAATNTKNKDEKVRSAETKPGKPDDKNVNSAEAASAKK